MEKVDLETLVSIAAEVEKADPIDWDQLNCGRLESFKLIATTVIENFDKEEYTIDDKYILLATITKLLVENMHLNIKVLMNEQQKE